MNDTTHHVCTMKSLFTKEQCQFLIEKYPTNGAEFCSGVLKIPLNKVKLKIRKLQQIYHFKLSPTVLSKKISDTRHKKTFAEYNIDPSQFLNITTPEVVYILGLLWADGYLYKDQINIEMVYTDLNELLPIFNKIGKWSVNSRHRINRKKQLRISTNNKYISKFLLENNYNSKSNMSAFNILKYIPENLKYYWFRGLSDGDGCFYHNIENSCHQFSISSSYDQDWSYMEALFNTLNISYRISRRKQLQKNKINKSSIIQVTNKTDIKKFGDYIYNNYLIDYIGLKRKFNKYQLLINDDQ